MKRDLMQNLCVWKDDADRKPLILRGARQVGKTWLVETFAQQRFENSFTINFELEPAYKSCFSDLNPERIIKTIELSGDVEITPGKTLLFLDEIQQCPEALKALRYFHEKKPELHVIGAGSLLEFALGDENLSMPVGRVQNFYLKPLSFGEYLTAVGEDRLRDFLRGINPREQVAESIVRKSVALIQDYFFIGGMPEAVEHWIRCRKIVKIQEIHQGILQNYRHDFMKYGKRVNIENLEKVFSKAPGLIGQKFKYSAIDRSLNSRDVKRALSLLCKAQVMARIHATAGSGLPLKTHANDALFKVLFLDLGLMQTDMGLSKEVYRSDNVLAVYAGGIAEQFVGQQLLCLQPHFEEPSLFYWCRDAKGSEAEVDYLWQAGPMIFPLEVKHGKRGTLKSLKLFLAENEAPFGVRISMHPPSFMENILSVPLYCIEALPRLLASRGES
ncbi:MAG: ATP-binding protein [Kiritimatiellae bacterium]|nr:ATP-binding protein [Kiritimatiellia bacterium]